MKAPELIQMGLDGLGSLRSSHGFDASDAATGLYPALYGRDSLWVLLLLLEAAALRSEDRVDALITDSGPAVLTSLAGLQGMSTNDLVEEQPGRIPHEYHPVPSSHAQEMALPLAQGRSYGGFDETFLFILAYHAFISAHPGHAVAEHLWPNVQRAISWIDTHADADGDGLFEYTRRHPANLLNQVWKDSFDSATHTGFDIPPQPLAWLEIQAYGYAVFRAYASMLANRGDQGTASQSSSRADALAQLVDEQFWLGADHGLAMALDRHKCPVRMVSSNPGHALWTRIVAPERVDPLIARMTQPDLLSAYGLRTLSRKSPFYAPFAYHRGNVWPFDNAVFALGLLRHNRVAEAVRVARSVGTALLRARTPVECYAVLEPEDLINSPSEGPLLCWRHFPVRNRVQAFTAAALVVFGTLIEVTD